MEDGGGWRVDGLIVVDLIVLIVLIHGDSGCGGLGRLWNKRQIIGEKSQFDGHGQCRDAE